MVWLLYLALLAIPFSTSAVGVRVFGATLTPYLLLMLLLLVLAAPRILMSLRRDYLVFSDIALLIVNLILLYHVTQGANGYTYVHSLLMPSVSYVVVRELLTTEKQIKRALLAYVIGSGFFAFVYVQAFVASGGSGRIYVLGRNAIDVGALASLAMFFLLAKPVRALGLRLGGLFLMLMLLVTTLSRSFIISMAIAPLFWWRRWYRRMLPFMVVLIGGTLVITLAAIENISFFMPSDWDPTRENTLERLYNIDYWLFGIHSRLFTFMPSLEQFHANPFFGVGFWTHGSTVHNFHMEWLSAAGLIGHLLLSFFICCHFRGVRKLGPATVYITTNFYFCIIMIFNGLLNGLMHGVLTYLFFVSLGIAAAARRARYKESTAKGTARTAQPRTGVFIRKKLPMI